MPARLRRGEIPPWITSLSVAGFKSLRDPQRVDIKPLTILAGVNSSGKSSIMQPLLLLKQTLEAPYDPGPLLLDGPNVSVTRIEQILSLSGADGRFTVGFTLAGDREIRLRFGRAQSGEVGLADLMLNPGRPTSRIFSEGLSRTDIEKLIPDEMGHALALAEADEEVTLERRRWTFSIETPKFSLGIIPNYFENAVRRVIHLPALRGNPRRTYRTAAVEETFPGVFNDYTAGMIAAWQARQKDERLARLRADLELLGLTSDVAARRLDDASVELLVGRLPHAPRKSNDLVNIADVGFGVSQTLPVVVALQVAAPGQLVYLEQPEIHLHPRAQAAFAKLLRAAVERGARIVVETHSALLIRAIQTMVAKGSLDGEDVALHWFSRAPDTGLTTITSATLDRYGAFGDWPEDFDEVSLQSDHEYLTAVERAEAREDSAQ